MHLSGLYAGGFAMNMAFYIARKDFRLHLRSSRFVLTLLLCLLLVPFTILTGTDNYFIRQTACQQGKAAADSALNSAYV